MQTRTQIRVLRFDFEKLLRFRPTLQRVADGVSTALMPCLLNKNIKIEHYIVSSGNARNHEGTHIEGKFKAIYASRFIYDHKALRRACAGDQLHHQDSIVSESKRARTI